MTGSITLPQIVLDLEEEDRKVYEALKAPKTIVVRYGALRFVAELPYDGEDKPGCGSKLVIRSRRGIEMGEMLTTTCGNGGCGKNITRKQMLEYIDNSGGRDYPFTTEGRILRVATVEDLNEQMRLDGNKMPMIRKAREVTQGLGLQMKIVDVELLLGGERVIFHYTSEAWIDFRELVRLLAAEYQTRIEMHQVNARDEARLVADYEKCGQHCCCKQFLKVLKPVSMRSAKVQKATLDPTKISGRCGRLMCCLRYEDQTYEQLRKRLPNRQTRVMTADGPGTVIDTQILTQLALVRLDKDFKPAAYPIENIEILAKDHANYRPPPPPMTPEERAQSRGAAAGPRPQAGRGPGGQGGSGQGSGKPTEGERRSGGDRPSRGQPRRPSPGAPLQEGEIESREGTPSHALPKDENSTSPERSPSQDDASLMGDVDGGDGAPFEDATMDDNGAEPASHDGSDAVNSGDTGTPGTAGTSGTPGAPGEGGGRRRRRRRRRGRGRGQGGNAGPSDSGPPPSP